MAAKAEIQYVSQFYVYGSEAKVLELKPKRKIKTILPLSAPDKTIKIPVDPVICQGGDEGTPFSQRFAKSVPGKIFEEMINKYF